MGGKQPVYETEFKKSLVTMHQSGKSLSEISREYGVSTSALSKWVRQYSQVKTETGEVMTALEVTKLKRRLAELEEENIILKKAAAIFMQHSDKD